MRISKRNATLYRSLADQYQLATGQTRYEVSDVVAWAMDRGQLDSTLQAVIELHCLRMSEALRSDTVLDSRQRHIRLRYSLVIQDTTNDGHPRQRTLWADVDKMDESFRIESLTQRRSQIAADVASLRADLDYSNAIRAERGLPPIQLSFDFNEPGDGFAEAGA